jgi:citrate synthase
VNDRPITRIATHDETSITVRGNDLVRDLIGRHSFTEMIYFHATGRWPSAGQATVLDACLVTLMEHGLTPSAIVTRLVADSVPDEAQVAIATGLLCVGGVFAGTMEGTARILADGIAGDLPPAEYCAGVVADHRARRVPLPGFGHPQHRPDDPRTPRLFEVAGEAGVSGPHIALLKELSTAVDAGLGRHLTINATGAMAALMLDAGLPLQAMRPMAVVSRSAGLVAHLIEEKETRSARYIWGMVEEGIPMPTPSDSGRAPGASRAFQGSSR